MKKILYSLVLITGMAYGQQSVVTFPYAASGTIPPENIVAIYQLDALDGVMVLDASANGNTGTAINGPIITTPGLIENAMTFNGVDQYVEFVNTSSFDINNNAVTVSLWTVLTYLPADLPGSFGPLFDSETDNYVLYEDKGNNELRFKCRAGADAARPGISGADPDLVTGEWIHIVGVYDGTEASIYLNGVKKGSLPLSGTVVPGMVPFLGRSAYANASFFEGSIDQVEIYNIALTEEQIMERYLITSIGKLSISGVNIYPNPNNGKFTLDQKSLSLKNARIEVVNAQGKIMFKDKLNNSVNQSVNLPSANKGLYFVRIYSDSGVHTQPMIVN
jgi:hypothetical protein